MRDGKLSGPNPDTQLSCLLPTTYAFVGSKLYLSEFSSKIYRFHLGYIILC